MTISIEPHKFWAKNQQSPTNHAIYPFSPPPPPPHLLLITHLHRDLWVNNREQWKTHHQQQEQQTNVVIMISFLLCCHDESKILFQFGGDFSVWVEKWCFPFLYTPTQRWVVSTHRMQTPYSIWLCRSRNDQFHHIQTLETCVESLRLVFFSPHGVGVGVVALAYRVNVFHFRQL